MLRSLLILAALCAALQAQAALQLESDRALVIDRDTGQTLYAKDADEAAPIASVTKLMTAIVLLDEKPDLDQMVTITSDDVDRLKFSSSRLPVGARLKRSELLHLTLMSSENRAAHALARTSAKGRDAFIQAMNAKARALGMTDAHFADPTGLSPANRASAQDLGKLVEAASAYAPIRRYSADEGARLRVGGQRLVYRNSNPVVSRLGWDVLLSKTGFIREAGRVVVVGFEAAGRNLAVVLMGADSVAERTRDLVRVRQWVTGVSERVKARVKQGVKSSVRAKSPKAKLRAKSRRR
jgi:D-alanyl-D-alanine endopeptidase (penicillin-binding protein 7)